MATPAPQESRPAPSAAPARRPLSALGVLRQIVGSTLFNLEMWLSVLVYAPLMLLTFPLPFRWRYYLISRWAKFQVWLIGVLCGVHYRVEGLERLPPGPAVVMAKHQSTWETFALPVLLPPQTWVLKRELMWVPLFGWALALLKPIAIDRASRREAFQQVIEQGRERLREGIWVTVFPEGTRVPPGQRGRWRHGGAVLAAETGYPVVPVAHNAGLYWPRRAFIKRPGVIRVVIGPSIDTRGLSGAEVARRSEEWVMRTTEELERSAE